MSISEQVKELRNMSSVLHDEKRYAAEEIMRRAADTIEALSAKLQAANMERSSNDYGKSVLKIDTPKVCIDCPCHFAGESGLVMCGVEKRELLSDNIETFKPDWCPLREQQSDCGGWIPCEHKPQRKKDESSRPVLVRYKDETAHPDVCNYNFLTEKFVFIEKDVTKYVKEWREIPGYEP